MGTKTVWGIAAWGMAGAVLGWLVWQRLVLGFGALWLIPLGWGATAAPLEAGALMAGYYGATLSGSIVALTLFEGPWAGVPGWAACTALLAAPWALARAGHVASRFPQAGVPLRYLTALVLVSLPPLGALGMASPWVAATASLPGLGLWGLVLTLPVSALLAYLGARLRESVTSMRAGEHRVWRPFALSAAALALLVSYGETAWPVSAPPARLITLNTHNWEPAGKPARGRVLRQNRRLILDLAAHIARMPAHTTFVLPEDAAVHWSPFTAWAWWPLALKAYRHHDTVALGVYMRPAHDTEKRDALLLMGRHAGLVTARQPMPVTEWLPFTSGGARAHWMRFGPTRAFGPPAAVLICYEQLLVWPVAEAFMGSARPQVLIGASDHWWIEPDALDATEARMQARVLRAWGRLYGVPVILADNRPHVARDLRAHWARTMVTSALSRPIPTLYGQNTDKIRTSRQEKAIRAGGRSYGSVAGRSINNRIMAPPYPPSPPHHPPKEPT